MEEVKRQKEQLAYEWQDMIDLLDSLQKPR
jgi:hypothetical protein